MFKIVPNVSTKVRARALILGRRRHKKELYELFGTSDYLVLYRWDDTLVFFNGKR